MNHNIELRTRPESEPGRQYCVQTILPLLRRRYGGVLQRYVSCLRGSFSQSVLSHLRPGSQNCMATNVLRTPVELGRSPFVSDHISFSAGQAFIHNSAGLASNLVVASCHLPLSWKGEIGKPWVRQRRAADSKRHRTLGNNVQHTDAGERTHSVKNNSKP